LEKLKREIERLAGSIIRQEIVDHGLNAAMTAWHLTEWTWREIQGSIPRIRSVTEKAGTSIRELKQFQQFVKRDCAELAYCEGIAISTKHFTFSKLPVFSTKVTERFKINPDPIGKMAALRGTNSRQPARPLAMRRKAGAGEVSGSEAARVHHAARRRGRVAARGERAARIGEITRRSATRPQVDCRGGATNPISSPPRAKSR